MRKPTSIGRHVESSVWNAHISKATSSKHYAKEYKSYSYVLDEYQIMADRIKNGMPVGESYLKGKQKEKLLEITDLTEKDFKKYLE
jgi:hypothetical protein|tara:strand:+ start:939 stop:1196 length:258 start_codon:yes stop_codon:yes gene_type:complete